MNAKTRNSGRLRDPSVKGGGRAPRDVDTGEKGLGGPLQSIRSLTLRGRSIRVDEQNRVCLNDLHKAGGFSVYQKPSDWAALPNTSALTVKVLEKTTGKSGYFTKSEILSVICSRKGRHGGVWVHPNLALAYAKYLSSDLHYEVNDVFLRAKSGDAKLADEILEKASPQANAWAGARAMSRAERNGFTSTLKDHGVKGWGYGACTNEIYVGLFDLPAKELKTAKGVRPNGALRDQFNVAELSYTAAAEHLAGERIAEEKRHGNQECREATAISAGHMRKAIDADRASRRKAP